MNTRYPICGLAWFALVALRFGIGVHFYQEGVSKLKNPKPFSAGFFTTAKGELAPVFQKFVWDADGRARFDQEATRQAWERERNAVASHYRFSEEQQKTAEETQQAFERQLEDFFAVHAEDLQTYFRGLERRSKNQADAARQGVPSLRGQSEKIESELKKERGPWLAQIDRLWEAYEKDLNGIATDQQKSRGWYHLGKPGRKSFQLDTVFFDKFIPYFDLTIGVCLMLGLFTRLTASAGAAFLATIIATQPPWVHDAAPVYYQSIEALALFFLAAVGAGRYGGLDFLVNAMRMRCCPPKTVRKS